MITPPKISVILPFYNAESTLNRAIESIYNQTYSNFECILINNNSTDKSADIAAKWVNQDARFIVIDEHQQGVVHASNAGEKMATGRYIARMDADDWSFPDRLSNQTKFLDNNSDYGVVSGMVEYMPHHKNTDGFARFVEWANTVKSANDIYLKRFIEAPIINPTAMWRKELGDLYGLYIEGDFPEDYEMWLRWLHNGVKMHKLDYNVLRWYDSNERLTRTQDIYSDASFYKIKTHYLALWLKTYNQFYPKVVIWGASKTSREHAFFLKTHGTEIQFYIDITNKRQIPEDVVYYKDLQYSADFFILVYMKHNDIRFQIKEFLEAKGYVEGESFLFVS